MSEGLCADCGQRLLPLADHERTPRAADGHSYPKRSICGGGARRLSFSRSFWRRVAWRTLPSGVSSDSSRLRRISLARSRTGLGHAGQARHLDAVALVGAALDDFAQEDDLVVPFAHGDVEILHARQAAGQFGQLVVMGGEERLGADLVVQVLDDAPGQAQAVKGAGAAADLVQDNRGCGRWRC